jgi:ion channel POLLUX/CASTOR
VQTRSQRACRRGRVQRGVAAWVVNLTHLLGLFSYALLLGIVSDDVQRTVEAFKRGNSAVCERGHTVVLNANATTDNLLRQARF